MHRVLGVQERFHRFKEVSGVPIIEAAADELNARLAARGAHHGLISIHFSFVAVSYPGRKVASHNVKCSRFIVLGCVLLRCIVWPSLSTGGTAAGWSQVL